MADNRYRRFFAMRRQDRQDAAVVSLEGELDVAARDAIRAELLGLVADETPVVVDLSDAEFLDSHVMTAIVAAARRAEEAGGQLAVACPQGGIRRVFELTGFAGALPVHGSVPDAVTSAVRRS